MRYQLGCSLSYQLAFETTFILNLEVARITSQNIVQEALTFTPPLEPRVYTDPIAANRYVGLNVPAGAFSLEYNAEVELTTFHADPTTIDETPVNQICGWIHDHLVYQPGASNEQTTADETLMKRAGVCRDFAHLGIAFCRALGIPARFVSCYAYGLVPSDFHAVFEAYLSGRWWLFDATRQAQLDGLVRIGIGRDAAEIAFSTPFGNFAATGMQVRIARSDGVVDMGPRTVDAISTDEAREPT